MNLASTYFGAGSLHASTAAPMRSRDQKTLHLREARSFFAKSVDIWQNIGRGRHLTDAQAKLLADSAHELALCDQALANLVN